MNGRRWGKIIRDLVKRFGRALRKVWTPWLDSAHPIELRQAILDDVSRDVVATGGGERVYPYTHLKIRLLGETFKERAQLDATLVAEDRLAEGVRRHLADLGIPADDLAIHVAVMSQRTKAFGDQRFAIYKVRRDPGPDDPSEPRLSTQLPVPRLTVVRGNADRKTFTLDQDRVAIGRLREVTDEHGRLCRRNDVAFSDDDEESRSVSREHARIERRGAEFRVIDDRSATGTQIFRDGRTIRVSSMDRRGILLQPGDLIHFGKAAVRFDLRDP